MSWITNPEGDRPARAKRPTKLPAGGGKDTSTDATAPDTPLGSFPLNDDYPKVHDPSDSNRMVSTKQANRPFLAYVVPLLPYFHSPLLRILISRAML